MARQIFQQSCRTINTLEEKMKTRFNSIFSRHAASALALGTVLMASTVVTGIAQAANSDIKIGFTPKFLKDDFQTLMLDLSKKAFEAKESQMEKSA